MKHILKIVVCSSAFFACLTTAQPITLNQAIALAWKNDPWLDKSKQQQSALLNQSIAANTEADPRISIGLMNMPIDSWQFDQEAMTQLAVGVTQTFARGDTLTINQEKIKAQASLQPLLRQDRKAQVKVNVTQLWLDLYLSQQKIRMIEQDKVLFEQMVDISKANYASVLGKANQQEVISAQLALVKLQDRLVIEQQKLAQASNSIQQWLIDMRVTQNGHLDKTSNDFPLDLGNALPVITLKNASLIKGNSLNNNAIVGLVGDHPQLLLQNGKNKISLHNVALAKQQYQPKWGVTANYGYRDESPTDINRSDFFSVGVSFDVPLFTENKQDKLVNASIAESAAIATEKTLVLRNMLTEVKKLISDLHRLSERQSLYQDHIINQTHQQAEAALTAYTHDNGSFAQVVLARIAQLDTKITNLELSVEALKTTSRLNYFFTQLTTVQHERLINQ